jgi:hypothetical protein
MAGTITVGELLSDPTSSNKITIGSGTTLDLASGAGSVTGAGKVLQVVSVPFTTGMNNGSSSFVATGHSATITPSSSSSKILVILCGGAVITNGAGRQQIVQMYRNGSALTARSSYKGFAGEIVLPHSMSLLDSPNTTSATTYEPYVSAPSGGVYYSAGASWGIPILTLMEIAQ